MVKAGYFLASALLQRRVRNSSGEVLGKIEEFVVDAVSGDIVFAAVTFGSVVGVGSKFFAVPWSAFKISPTHDHLVLEANESFIRHAPSFHGADWPDMADAAWQRNILDYYGVSDTAPAGKVSSAGAVSRNPGWINRTVLLSAFVLTLILLIGLRNF